MAGYVDVKGHTEYAEITGNKSKLLLDMPSLESKYSDVYQAFLFLRSCKKHDEPISILEMTEYLKYYFFDFNYFFSVIKHLDAYR